MRIKFIFLCLIAVYPIISTAQTWKRAGLPISNVRKLNFDRNNGNLNVEFSTVLTDSSIQNGKNYIKKTTINTKRTYRKGIGKIDIIEEHRGEIKGLPQAKIIASGNTGDIPLSVEFRYMDNKLITPVNYSVEYILEEFQNLNESSLESSIWTEEKDTTFLKKSTLRHIYENYFYYNRPFRKSFIAGINFTNLLNYRMVLIKDPTFQNHDQIDLRSQNEFASYGQAFSITAGLNIGRKNFLYLELSSFSKGFRNENGHVVDWSTGLPGTGNENFRYKFQYHGVGIGYSRSRDSRVVNPVLDMGVSLSFLREFVGESGKVEHNQLATNDVTKHLNRTDLILKAGIGINIIPSLRYNFRIIPTFYYGLIPVNSGQLNTRLISFGINTGMLINTRRTKN